MQSFKIEAYLLLGCTDSGGYVKFTPKYTIVPYTIYHIVYHSGGCIGPGSGWASPRSAALVPCAAVLTPTEGTAKASMSKNLSSVSKCRAWAVSSTWSVGMPG
jgi:hypothetical protein